MGLFDAIASTVGNLTDNVVGMVNQNHQNKVNLRMMREQNSFNAEQSQLQRDWQERMWSMNNSYNSPNAMIARGLNPFIGSSAGAGVSKSPASGGAAATAAPVPSMQAFRPNFSNVFNSLASLAQAKKAQSESNNIDAITPQIADYYKGLTNWKNLAIGESGFWNKETGRISASLDQSTEAQELKNLQFSERLSAAQETQILLNSDAQRILNRYLDEQQQADLFIKGQTLVNLQLNGALTEKQIQTELQLLLPGQLLNPVLPAHGLFPCGKALIIHQLHRPFGPGIFGACFAFIMGFHPPGKAVCPAGVERAVTAAQDVDPPPAHSGISMLTRSVRMDLHRAETFLWRGSSR